MAALNPVQLIFHPDFALYDFGLHHPLRPERLSAGLDLLEAVGVWGGPGDTFPVSPAADRELELVHSPGYVEAVRLASEPATRTSDRNRFGLGPGDTPAFDGMHGAAALVAGGAVGAVRAVMNHQIDHAFSPGGGWHHAHADRASGFCVYNDPAVAAAIATRDFGARVLYLDFDCHHGDGVQWIFYDSPQVMTVSFHESGRYLFPGSGAATETGRGRGQGYALNLPFMPFTRDTDWCEAVQAVVPAVATRFKPDLILSAHGADTHSLDPLTHLALSTRAFAVQARVTHEIAHEHAHGSWIAFGSGGYDWRRVVPRSWAILWSEMTGRRLPEQLPSAWTDRWLDADSQHISHFLDPEIDEIDGDDLKFGETDNREILNTAMSQVTAMVPA